MSAVIVGDRVQVTWFDTFKMRNHVGEGVVEDTSHNSVTGEDFVFVRVTHPVRKTVKVPVEFTKKITA